MAERNTGNTVEFIKKIAYRHNIAVAGSFIADSGVPSSIVDFSLSRRERNISTTNTISSAWQVKIKFSLTAMRDL